MERIFKINKNEWVWSACELGCFSSLISTEAGVVGWFRESQKAKDVGLNLYVCAYVRVCMYICMNVEKPGTLRQIGGGGEEERRLEEKGNERMRDSFPAVSCSAFLLSDLAPIWPCACTSFKIALDLGDGSMPDKTQPGDPGRPPLKGAARFHRPAAVWPLCPLHASGGQVSPLLGGSPATPPIAPHCSSRALSVLCRYELYLLHKRTAIRLLNGVKPSPRMFSHSSRPPYLVTASADACLERIDEEGNETTP
ncbi:uncharacterized protein VTP21DRAFT_4709 [Calcarisporiella thermophila]|uniref:uncharacterized protein n=1 Tax=Calcarisporiella thermophila TaxID=911321 RepID=UPI0037444A37